MMRKVPLEHIVTAVIELGQQKIQVRAPAETDEKRTREILLLDETLCKQFIDQPEKRGQQ